MYLGEAERLVVLGDSNRRLPRSGQPAYVFTALGSVVSGGHGQGGVCGQIDHLLVGTGIKVLDVVSIPRSERRTSAVGSPPRRCFEELPTSTKCKRPEART